MADWLTVLDTLQTTVLPFWDAWCPDDGRPAALLAACRAYCTSPTVETAARLVSAREAALSAECMAFQQLKSIEDDESCAHAWTALLVLLDCSWAMIKNTCQYNSVIQHLVQRTLGLSALDLPPAPVIR